MARDGSGIRQLTSNEATDANPAFSPDGKTILFSTDRDGNAEIYRPTLPFRLMATSPS